jgi:hypothetical protein
VCEKIKNASTDERQNEIKEVAQLAFKIGGIILKTGSMF